MASIAARIDRLPPTRFLNAIVARIAVGGFFEFYDLFMTGYIGVGFIKSGIFAEATGGPFDVHGFASFVGAGFLGMFVGTLFFSNASDRYGRRSVFVFSIVWYSLATFVMALQSDAVWIVVWRAIAGVGVGVQLVTNDTYVVEIAPKAVRGRYLQFTQFVALCAVPVVALVARVMIPQTPFGIAGWRFVAILGALGAVFALFLRRGLPESPRWLDANGRGDEASAVVDAMEEAARRETGRALVEPDDVASKPTVRARWADIWKPPFGNRTTLMSVFNFFQAIGFYGFASWVPILLVHEGISVTKSLTYVFAIALLAPIGALVGVFVGDRFERKWQIVYVSLAIAACGLLWSQQRGEAGVLFFGGLVTLLINYFSGVYHAYQQELFPTAIRGRAVGFAYSWSRFSNVFVGFAIAAALKAYGPTGVFLIVGLAMLVVAGTIGFFGLKTNDLSLERISE